MVGRREFLRTIALAAAGAAALPEQIIALEKIYDVNAPLLEAGLIAIDDVYIGGFAARSTPRMFEFSVLNQPKLNLAMNLFGGIVRWVAVPDGRIFTREEDFNMRIITPEYDKLSESSFYGSIHYTDQNFVRRMVKFEDKFSRLIGLPGASR